MRYIVWIVFGAVIGCGVFIKRVLEANDKKSSQRHIKFWFGIQLTDRYFIFMDITGR